MNRDVGSVRLYLQSLVVWLLWNVGATVLGLLGADVLTFTGGQIPLKRVPFKACTATFEAMIAARDAEGSRNE